MNSIYRFTTPAIRFTLPFETNYLTESFITISQRDTTKIEKALSDCTIQDKTVLCELSQEETGNLTTGAVAYIQLRIKGNDDKAYASQIQPLEIKDVLKKGVI